MARFALALALFLTLAAPAAAGVDTPQGGWYSGNPLLGPNDLTDVSCSAGSCYASGAFGTLLHAGGSGGWQGTRTGLTETLPHVRTIAGDPRKAVFAGRCRLWRSDDAGARFRPLPVLGSGAGCAQRIDAFSFPTGDIGVAALSDGGILRSTDGGRTWARRGRTAREAGDLLCTAADRCFAALRGGSLARTADGGQTWTSVAAGGADLRAIDFPAAQVGYAAGADALLATADGGDSWQERPVPAGEDLTDVSCSPAQPDVCVFATSAGDHVLRTTDGGRTFTTVAVPILGAAAVSFAGADQVVAAGAGGGVALSADRGVTWREVGGSVPGDFRVLRATGSAGALAGGARGVLARTTDAGQSWSAINLPTASDVVDVASPGGDTIYSVDRRNRFERSTDGGATWKTVGPRRPPAYAITTLGGGHVLLVGRHSVLVSRDRGDTFKRARLDLVPGDSLSSVDRAGAGALVYGPHALLVTADDARTFRHMRLPRLSSRDAIHRVDFVAPRVGYLLSGQRRLFFTSDAGHDWAEVLSTGGGGADIAFSDRLHGWLAVPGYAYRYSGAVLRTSNGGATWHPQVLSAGFLQHVAASGRTGYALSADPSGKGGAMFATRKGGDAGLPSLITVRPSARKIARGRKLTIRGRLTPVRAGAQVVLSGRSSGRWISRVVAVGARGYWTSTWKLSRSTLFVAQALGDATYAGAGTRPLLVQVAAGR